MRFPEGRILAPRLFFICLDDALQCTIASFELSIPGPSIRAWRAHSHLYL